jgi:hypothetical protein
MKLEKNTKYLLKTEELYDAFLKDAEAQGYRWLSGDEPTKRNYYYINTKHSCIYIDGDGALNNGSEESMARCHPHAKCVEYKNIPEIYPINFGCIGVDAPDFNTAYRMFTDYITKLDKKSIDLLDMLNEKVYTVKVQCDRTTVITPEGKMATAKCHPDDDFDVVEGFRVAMEKIKRQDIKLNQKERDILNAIVMLGGTSFYINDEHYLIADFDDESVYVSIEEDDFKWCEEYEDYNVKELLEQCS